MNEKGWVGAAVLVALGVVGWDYYQAGKGTMARGGGVARHVTPPSFRGSALDNSLGQVTPDDLIHFGPPLRPHGWVPHRVTYPAYPGQNLEVLVNGAPMACVTESVPRAQRGWLFAPPSEVDI